MVVLCLVYSVVSYWFLCAFLSYFVVVLSLCVHASSIFGQCVVSMISDLYD